MVTHTGNSLLEYLKAATASGKYRQQSDGDLLRLFVKERNEQAFATIVHRHGPMVAGVCRRILNDPSDVDDAFQAVFLVLCRRASSVRPPEMISRWLYGVAYRTALHLRRQRRRTLRRQRELRDYPAVATNDAASLAELRPLLDGELNRLPLKYRTAIILADLEGRSRKEIAEVLRIPEGTVSSRLATGRKLLAKRLARRGLVPAILAAMPLSRIYAAAGVSKTLSSATCRIPAVDPAALPESAVRIAEGVIHSMNATRRIIIGSGIVFGIALVGIALVHAAGTAPPDQAKNTQSKNNQRTVTETKGKTQTKNGKAPVGGVISSRNAVQAPFDRVEINHGSIVLRPAEKPFIEVEGEGVLVAQAKTSVKDGVLHVQAAHPQMKLIIGYKNLREVAVKGAGSLTIEGLDEKQVAIRLGGPCRALARGKAATLRLEVGPGGQFDGRELTSTDAEVTVAGGAMAIVNATGTLKVHAKAGGRVSYLGTPDLVTESVIGATVAPYRPVSTSKQSR